MNRPISGAAIALLLLSSSPLRAQDADEKARIDYEVAKIALAEKKPALALEKLELALRGALGQDPEVLTLAADAALQAGKPARAKELVSLAFAALDAACKKKPEYRGLINLAAKIEVQGWALESRAKVCWVDASTKLMWTVKDNGGGISGNDAVAWCRANRAGGFSDWRQPTIEELAGLYDPSAIAEGKPKIKAPIELSAGGWGVWSGTPSQRYGDKPGTWIFYYEDGSRTEFPLDFEGTRYRALCVRPSGE